MNDDDAPAHMAPPSRAPEDPFSPPASPDPFEPAPFPPVVPDAAAPARPQWGRAPHRSSTRRPQPIKEPEAPKESESGPAAPIEPPLGAPEPGFPEGA
jgi:hypothetical protein